MTTTDETGVEPDLAIRCAVDGVVRQDSRPSDLVFKPVDLVAYLSHITASSREISFSPGRPAA